MSKKLPGEIVTFSARRESLENVDQNSWYKKIILILKDSQKPLSARQISQICFDRGWSSRNDRQLTAPRLTELHQIGGVNPCDERVYDPVSGVKVTVYSLGKDYEKFL